jgi:tetratricopeptide (TPR) repeat protein
MALADPYGPCPCGSGQKYKWCCHKVEGFAERAIRQIESGQADAALATLNEGLKAAPGNPLLGIRKAVLLSKQGQIVPAREAIEAVLQANPDHVSARSIYINLVMQTDGPAAAVEELQHTLSGATEETRGRFAAAAQFVGLLLAQAGRVAAGLEHLRLSARLAPEATRHDSVQYLQEIERDRDESLWFRQPYTLSPVPNGLGAERAEQFAQALAWADQGRWSDAAALFQLIAGDEVATAERNLALCRLWLTDDVAARDALGRYLRLADDTPDAVDFEALRQLIRVPTEEELVDHVQLIWSLRSRDLLLNALNASDRVSSEGRGPLDPEAEPVIEVDYFSLLDRPKTTAKIPQKIEDQPRVLGRLLVGNEIVVLDTFDDGRLDDLTATLRDLAGSAIPPAHPKTKEVGKVRRSALRVQGDWWYPGDLDPTELDRLEREARKYALTTLWPETPAPELNGRSPTEAAKDPALRLSLRAALAQIEQDQGILRDEIDFPAIRSQLGLAPEPPIRGESIDIETILPTRLHLCVAEELSDEALIALYGQGLRFQLETVVTNAATAIIARPDGPAGLNIGYYPVYHTLAQSAIRHGARDEALQWVRRGAEADPQGRGANAVRWELLEVRIRAQTDHPELWVPALAMILDRYKDDSNAAQYILSGLVELGLVRVSPHPDNPEQMLVDSRLLQAVLAEYGPKITTATGELGVSAAKGGIWTPGSDAGTSSGGGIWTPGGSSPAAPGDKPKLIIPGR